MSPRTFNVAPIESVTDGVRRFWAQAGLQIRDARMARKQSVASLAKKAGVSKAIAYFVEAGRPTSVEAVVRLASALGLRVDLSLVDPRRRDNRPNLSADPVHSAMGEFEAQRFRELRIAAGLDEPYQHYQFAGRADFVAWDVEARALLHIENRTRFPDFQEMAGAFNSKSAYLGKAIAGRLGLKQAWRSETHVIAALWSSEVLHALRLRTESIRTVCPHSATSFDAWWSGQPPPAGTSKTLVVLDPFATARQRPFVDLEAALSVRPRYRGYADAAARAQAAA